MKIGVFDKVDERVLHQHLKEHMIFKENIPSDIDVAIIRGRTPVNEKFLEKYRALKYVLMVGTGLDHIDLEACRKRGIKVFNAPGCNANAVSELFFFHIINALRHGCEACYDVKSNSYLQVNRAKYHGMEVKGKTIGFIGVGAIAKLIIKKLEPWGCKAIGYDVYQDKEFEKHHEFFKYASLEEVLTQSDVLSINAPLTPETKSLINEKTLEKMKKGIIIINLARGEIVNSNDILKGLDKGKVAYYGADVLGNEKELTFADIQLQNHSKTCITPHIGAQTKEALALATKTVIEQFLKSLQ